MQTTPIDQTDTKLMHTQLVEGLVSVVLPIYNAEDYIYQCLHSVLAQTYQHLEILCVNDCTPDNSITIAKEVARGDARVSILHNVSNLMLGGARNSGIEAARGQYIMFIDPEDYLEPTMVEKLVAAIERDNSDLALCNIFIVPPNGSKKETTPTQAPTVLQKNFFLSEDLEQFCWVWPSAWNKLYKMNIILQNKIRYRPHTAYAEHKFFYEYLFQSNSTTYVQEPLYNYRYPREEQLVLEASPSCWDIFIVLEDLQKIFFSALPKQQAVSVMCRQATRLLHDRMKHMNEHSPSYRQFIKDGRRFLSRYSRKDLLAHSDRYITNEHPLLISTFTRLKQLLPRFKNN